MDGTGILVATLERVFDLPGREEFVRRLGYDELPEAYGDALPP